MARTQRYKNIERNAMGFVGRAFRRAFKALSRCVQTLLHVADTRLTVMIVPHSQGRTMSFETSVAALVLAGVIAVGAGVTCVYFARGAAGGQIEIARLAQQRNNTQASLDELRDANVSLLQTAKRFREALEDSLGNSLKSDSGANAANGGDLASVFNVTDAQSAKQGAVQETQEIKELTEFLDNAISPVEQFGKMFDSRAVLFQEIPSIWPVANPSAHISMPFGPNVHPITGQWYVHKGIDFSTFRSGDKVVATADGYVARVGYDLGLGNYVIIKHKHGIYTRYAHMMYSTVKMGQYVSQKDLIGYVGNTGVTTGPHLHYEIHIGSDVVDPARYINVKIAK